MFPSRGIPQSSFLKMATKNGPAIVFFLVSVCKFAQSDDDNWGYTEQEGSSSPQKWPKGYPACGRSLQSPINFDKFLVQDDPQLRPVSFIDYEEYPPDHVWRVENNGHTVKISASYPCPPQIQGGGLGAKYQFLQIHFHWATHDFEGSEHHLDGRKYALEMHLVHQRRGKTMNEISRSQDPIGLAVVAVLFDLGNEPNHHLTPITEALKQVEAAGSVRNVTLPEFTLSSLLPEKPDFFRYNGSLTTPPCDELVQWTVMREPIRVNTQQLSAFRSLLTSPPPGADNNSIPIYIANNFRPVQPLSGRKVLRYRSGLLDENIDSSAHTDRINICALLLLLLTVAAALPEAS